MENEVLSLFISHPFAWIALIIGLIGLSYGAYSIKNEKVHFLKNAISRNLGGLEFITPAWWTLADSGENFLTFKRTDTRYDWLSNFENTKIDKDSRPKEEILNLMTKLKIDHDANADFTSGSIGNWQYSRVETLGTKEHEDRIHLDAITFKNDIGNTFTCYSLSSVLNGSVEGPYFDEIVKQIIKFLKFY